MSTYKTKDRGAERVRAEQQANGSDPYDDLYDARKAAAELRTYRAKGLTPWARVLTDRLKADGVAGASVLDIGGGIGSIHHELLEAGAASAVGIDASSAYMAAAREESDRRGHGDRVSYRHGDFIQLAPSVSPADIVILERVLNVSPEWEQLASLAAERTRRRLGVVIPRDTPFVRAVIGVINLSLRRRGKQVRAGVVPLDALDRIAATHGLRRRSVDKAGPAWEAVVYVRDG
jgi:magnesium-protoporphyrin O-methyltransferase